MQEQLREKNQSYNEMKQRFEASNDVTCTCTVRIITCTPYYTLRDDFACDVDQHNTTCLKRKKACNYDVWVCGCGCGRECVGVGVSVWVGVSGCVGVSVWVWVCIGVL